MKKPNSLFSVDADAKTVKGLEKGYLTAIMYLAPANIVSGLNLCPFASKGCKESCLYTAGRASFTPSIPKSRIYKTEYFRDHFQDFMTQAVSEINAFLRKAKRKDLIPVIRLNGTSDIVWENIRINENGEWTKNSISGKNIFELFSDVQFYDYTKNYKRFEKELPTNYSLTFSLSESNLSQAKSLIHKGVNVAAVFNVKDVANFPLEWLGSKVHNGDSTDLRFLDPKGVIVGLKAKGKAKKDTSGFVQSVLIEKVA